MKWPVPRDRSTFSFGNTPHLSNGKVATAHSRLCTPLPRQIRTGRKSATAGLHSTGTSKGQLRMATLCSMPLQWRRLVALRACGRHCRAGRGSSLYGREKARCSCRDRYDRYRDEHFDQREAGLAMCGPVGC